MSSSSASGDLPIAKSIPATRRAWPDYRAVWRWHFYAGLFCIPFVCFLAITGAIYLFKPQIAISLLTVSVSAVLLWWRRRATGVLGAPVPLGRPRFSAGLLAIVIMLGVLLPLFGASLVLVALLERLILRNLPGVRDWLGLSLA